MKTNTYYYRFFFVVFALSLFSCQKENITLQLVEDTSQDVIEDPVNLQMKPNYNVAERKRFTYNQFPLTIKTSNCDNGKKNLEAVNAETSAPNFFDFNGYDIKWVNISTKETVVQGKYFSCACGNYVVHVSKETEMIASAVVRVGDCAEPEPSTNEMAVIFNN